MLDVTRGAPDEPWSSADLLFLASALSRGMSLADAAGFLGRTEGEVRKRSVLISAAPRRQNPSEVRRKKAAFFAKTNCRFEAGIQERYADLRRSRLSSATNLGGVFRTKSTAVMVA